MRTAPPRRRPRRLGARLGAAALVAVVLAGAGCSRSRSKSDHHVATAAKLPPTPKVPKPPPPPPPAPPPPPLPRAGADGVYETGRLRYIVHLTGGARPSDKLPMVFDLHGGGGTAQMHRRDEVPEKARIVIPFGYYPAPRGGFEWYPKGVSGASAHHELARDLPPVIGRLAKSIAAIATAWPTEGKPIVTGHSQGGIVSYGLALFHPELIGWACPLAGQVPPQLLRSAHPAGPFPEVHGFHAMEDRVVAISDANNTIQALRRFGYKADLKPFHGSHGDAETVATEMSACLSRGIRHAPKSDAPPPAPR